MFTEEQKEILHKAGEILKQECSSRSECTGCPLNKRGVCPCLDDGFDDIGRALQNI
jgi:hypothetical protein